MKKEGKNNWLFAINFRDLISACKSAKTGARLPEPAERTLGTRVLALASSVASVIRGGADRCLEVFKSDSGFSLKALPWREHLPIVLVLCLGNAVAVVGFFGSQHYYKSKAEKTFVRSASQYTGALQRAIDSYLEVIHTVETLFTISDEVDRWEFYKFAGENLESRPGIKALGWVPRVRAEEREAYETRAEQDGLFGFQLTERDAQGSLVAAGSRSEYLPLYYLDPYEGNEDMLGHDLRSNPRVMQTLGYARDQGQMVAAAGMPMLGENIPRSDLTVMLPIYQTDETPDNVAARRENFAGAAIGIIGLDGMITAVMEELDTPVYSDIYLYDRENGSDRRLLYHYVSPLRRGDVQPLKQDQVFRGYYNLTQHKVAGQQWEIVVKPGPGQISTKNNTTPWNFATMSILLTAMMIQYMFSARNRTRVLSEANAVLASEVAERKAAEEAAQAAKDQAIMANGAKSEFLAMVSHELRTPLNAIIGFSEILSQQMFGPIGKEQYLGYAQDILSSGTHLLSLINDILDLSKIEADKFELNEEETRVDAAVEAALRIVRERAEEAGLKISVDIPSSLPALYADDRALKQILINLLSNAIKFTPNGGRIRVEAGRDQDDGVIITVSDTGIGIAEEDVEKVLQPFIQVDSALSRKYEGTGLGLTLTRSLVELHDSTLQIESEIDKGTTVRVVFGKDRVMAIPIGSKPAVTDTAAPCAPALPVRRASSGGSSSDGAAF